MTPTANTTNRHDPLVYPWQDAMPALGTMQALMPGLHWLRMPLPFALNHINLWALEDQCQGARSWTLVDAGVATQAIRDAWQTLWAGPLSRYPLSRMLVTHMHPDHLGNAQWLIDQFSAPQKPAQLWMSAADYFAAQIASQSTTGYGGDRAADYFISHGLNDPEGIAKIRARTGYYAAMVPDVPHSFRRLMDGMVVRIGERDWRCVAGHGHSPEHMALYNERDGVLIAGDMLLPRISTNVSVTDIEPEGDALGLFLASLRLMQVLPTDTLALPSHGLPFKGIHTRIQQLELHHHERLQEVLTACREGPRTAADMLPVLFKQALDLHQTTFAMGEAVAHLNHLWHQGVLKRWQDQGVWRFEHAH